VLTEDDARTFAAIYVFLMKLAGPLFWADLLIGPNADAQQKDRRHDLR